MHVARRAAQFDDPHSDEAVHTAVARLLEETGKSRGLHGDLHGVLQLLLADPVSRLERAARDAPAHGRDDGRDYQRHLDVRATI